MRILEAVSVNLVPGWRARGRTRRPDAEAER
jgi:hypothetical protein